MILSRRAFVSQGGKLYVSSKCDKYSSTLTLSRESASRNAHGTCLERNRKMRFFDAVLVSVLSERREFWLAEIADADAKRERKELTKAETLFFE